MFHPGSEKLSLVFYLFISVCCVHISTIFYDGGTSFIRPMGLLPASDHTHYAVVKSHSQDTSRMESMGLGTNGPHRAMGINGQQSQTERISSHDFLQSCMIKSRL